MAWPKIKNIIILMLLVTNLCLLAFVGWREIRDWQLQDKALEQAVSFLAERGIQVDERIVPRSAELPPMGMERDLEEEQTLAAALLGDGLTREERSGEVYVYEGERGLLQCHSSGEFWADFQSGAFPVPEGSCPRSPPSSRASPPAWRQLERPRADPRSVPAPARGLRSRCPAGQSTSPPGAWPSPRR